MADGTEQTAMEKVLAKLENLATSLGKSSPDDDFGGSGKPVPYERFYQVNERMKAAEAGLASMREEITSMGTAHETAMAELKESTATGIATLQTRHAEDLTFARQSFDDGDIASIRTQWQAQPEEGRPESAGAYWESIVAAARAHHEDPEKNEAPQVHRTLIPLMPKFDDKQGNTGAPPRGNPAPPRGGRRNADPGIPQRGAGRAAVLESIRKSRGEEA